MTKLNLKNPHYENFLNSHFGLTLYIVIVKLMFFQAAPVCVKDDDDDINIILFAFDNSFQHELHGSHFLNK